MLSVSAASAEPANMNDSASARAANAKDECGGNLKVTIGNSWSVSFFELQTWNQCHVTRDRSGQSSTIPPAAGELCRRVGVTASEKKFVFRHGLIKQEVPTNPMAFLKPPSTPRPADTFPPRLVNCGI